MNTKEELQKLIDNQVEESTIMEFKSSFAIQNSKWREELAKDVSAMANSNGGTIIFGIKQKATANGNAVAHKLTPIPYTEMTKDKLSQLLFSNIQPVIDNLEITYIPESTEAGYFVLDIPQSNTAHQNRLTHIYYKRRNATIEPMEDYEVRDIMSRNKTPLIDLEFQLVKTDVDVIEKSYSFIPTLGIQEKNSHRIDYKLNIRPINTGQILAKYINYFVYIPTCIVIEKQKFDIDGDYCVIFGDNTTRDLTGFVGGQKQYGPFRYDPILPGTYGNSLKIDLSFDKVDANNLPCIRYEMHADNAPTRTVTIEWNEIECLTKTKTETKDPMAPPIYPGY